MAQEYRLGFSTSPWTRFSFSAEVRHGDRHTDYPTPVLTNTAPYLYPGFFLWRDITSDQADARLVYRWNAWLRTAFNWRWRESWFSSASADTSGTVPGGQIDGGKEQANVYSLSAVLTPVPKLFLSAAFSFSDSKTTTAQNGADYLAPWQGQVYSVLASGNYTINPATTLNASYALSQSDFAQNNQATGLPLGIRYQRDALQMTIRRRLGKNVATSLGYAFYYYHEPTSGNVNNYRAQGVFGSLTLQWP
jgi:hypothetical protein